MKKVTKEQMDAATRALRNLDLFKYDTRPDDNDKERARLRRIIADYDSQLAS